MELSLSQAAATALVNISLAWIVGVLASRFWLMRGATACQELLIRRLSSCMAAGLFAAAVGTALSLWAAAAVMGDVRWLEAGPVLVAMLATTHYGHAGLLALGALALAMLAHWRLGRASTGMRDAGVITALILVFSAARVGIGHAYEQGPLSVAVGVELLHLLLMSLWIGAVLVAGWVVLPTAAASPSFTGSARARYLALMSDWATVALAGILLTGVYNSYRVLGSLQDLLESDYGHVLVFKLSMVLVAIGLGGLNRFYGLPSAVHPMKAERGLRSVIAILRIESLVLLLVLAAAAVLTSSAPPG